MLFFNRYEKVTLENCGTQTLKPNLVRYKKSRSAGTLYCTQCPNFSKRSQNQLNYHSAKKDSARKLMLLPSVNFVIKNFLDFTPYVNTKALNMEHNLDSE